VITNTTVIISDKCFTEKLAECVTDSRLFTTDVLPSSKSRDTKTWTNIKNPAQSNLDIVP